MVDHIEKLGLKKVINASGKMTALGVSKVSDEVALSQKIAGQNFFVMDELMEKSGAYLAKLLNAEDAQIVSSASAGIAQCVAAVIGCGCTRHLYHPYDSRIEPRREIVMPKGHNVDYGTPVELMVAQGGGVVREAGYANMCTTDHIRQQITHQTAAILYVKSHHTVQKSMLSVEDAIQIANACSIPLIIDAAAEEDLFYYTKAGADLVIYSGAKAFEGPSSGLVIGKKKYVEWVRMQAKGIGRSMKIGKDNVFGLITAIETYLHTDTETGISMKARLLSFVERLNGIPRLTADIVGDLAGRDIYRARVKVCDKLDATELIAKQQIGNPAIYTRDHQANNGIIEYDIRAVDADEMNLIVTRLTEIIRELI